MPGQDVPARSPRRAQHLTGLPRFKHANAHGASFIYNGCSSSAEDFKLMQRGEATWIAPFERRFKAQTMVQEEGKIASERRALVDDSTDRIVYLTSERDHAMWAASQQAACVEKTEKLLLTLKLDGSTITTELEELEKAGREANAAIRTSAARRVEMLAEYAKRKNADAITSPLTFHPTHTKCSMRRETEYHPSRSFERFLKEGPRQGDGCFKGGLADPGTRLLHAALPRSHQMTVTTSLWARP